MRRHLLDPLPAAAVPELAAALQAVAERLTSAQQRPDRVVTPAEGAPMEVSRKHVLQVMRRVGLADRVDEAERLLPDPVDVDRDQALFDHFGMSIGQIMDTLGGSP